MAQLIERNLSEKESLEYMTIAERERYEGKLKGKCDYMKFIIYFVILIPVFFFDCMISKKDDFQSYGYVIDDADIVDDAFRKEISKVIYDFDRSNNVRILIHTTKSLNNLSIEEYSLNFANKHSVGYKYLNNGAVIVLVPNERKLRIEIGSGLEWIISNDNAKEIIDTMIPFLKSENYNEAIKVAVKKIIDMSGSVSWRIENKNNENYSKNDLNRIFQFKAEFISQEKVVDSLQYGNQKSTYLKFKTKSINPIHILITKNSDYQLDFLRNKNNPLITGRLVNLNPLTFQLFDFN
ncbi:MAG: TPM domain-containing protein [Leptospira sp.]|nr:TPM domain-containing protein [Leptospira sp.]